MDSRNNDIAIVILAAGSSSRLGRPKQLLQYDGKSLLGRTVETALKVSDNVIVITGSSEEEVGKDLRGTNARLIQNDGWQEGIASSIRLGVNTAIKNIPANKGVIFMVSDQPFANEDLLRKIINTARDSGMPIVASAYGGSLGIPAFFEKKFFSGLLGLSGDNGAKKLILQYPQSVARVDFPKGDIDIDTEKDFEKLHEKK